MAWCDAVANVLAVGMCHESERIEYKAGWNPDPIVRTLCAFANDFATPNVPDDAASARRAGVQTHPGGYSPIRKGEARDGAGARRPGGEMAAWAQPTSAGANRLDGSNWGRWCPDDRRR